MWWCPKAWGGQISRSHDKIQADGLSTDLVIINPQMGLNCRNVIMFPQVSDNDVQDLRKISGQGKPGILFKCLAQWLDRI